MLKRILVALFFILLAVFITAKIIGRTSRFSKENIRAELESAQLRYFIEQSNPTTGLVRDQANNFSKTPATNRMASMAATGFGLAVIANASTRGMIDSAFARDYTLKVLRFSRDHVPRRAGWFMHFADWETGERFGNSEYSTIDTALFMGGALYAARVLQDAEISAIVHQLYNDLDFQDALTEGGKHPEKRTLTMAYFPGEGYTTSQWNMYAEQRLLLLLGLGHPSHPLPVETWNAFARQISKNKRGEEIMGADMPLFIHQYSSLFVDFRAFSDGFPNYFTNGILATRAQREMVQSETKYKSFREGFWGLSAGAAPGENYETWSPVNHKGIVCIGCALGSAMFMPKEIMSDASHWARGPYHDHLWGRYGFTDSADLDNNWYSDHVYGITTGPLYLSLANMSEETSVWKDFMKIPEIQLALQRASVSGSKGPTQAGTQIESRKPGSTTPSN